MISISSHNINDPKKTQETQSPCGNISSGMNPRRSFYEPQVSNETPSHPMFHTFRGGSCRTIAPFSTDHTSAGSAVPSPSGSDHPNKVVPSNCASSEYTIKSRKSNSLSCKG